MIAILYALAVLAGAIALFAFISALLDSKGGRSSSSAHESPDRDSTAQGQRSNAVLQGTEGGEVDADEQV